MSSILSSRLPDAAPEAPPQAPPEALRPAARSPSEAVARARSHRLAPVARSIAAATVATLLFGAQPLAEWADNLPVGPLADRTVALAQAWQDAMAAVGLTRFGQACEAVLVALRGSR